jgi:hypothetical protein
MKRELLLAVGLWLLGPAALTWADEPPPRVATAQEAEFFEKRIRPVLADNCWSCHGPSKQKGGLRLDSLKGMLQGGENGAVVRAGDPDKSHLIQAVRYAGEIKMPPKRPLPPAAIDVLIAWVKMGAPWPTTPLTGPEATAAAGQHHWAFQPLGNPTIPTVKVTEWPQTSVDRFILAALEARALAPALAADRRTLIRRATFDLIGLPPTPSEIAAFETDPAPDAFARVVDRLLASPHYGERWGRYWLDVARYADTKGYVFFQESEFPWAYTYRDYVIRSFNEDLPYDRLVREQLAADKLTLGSDKRPLTALGFITLGGRFMNNEQDILDDRIDVVTRGLLGLTVACARCHDHKFDPITSRDYYGLYGVFASCVEPAVPPLFTPPPATAAYATFAKELQERERKLSEFVRAKHEELVRASRTRVAEYMMAVQAARHQPSAEQFMLIADGGDLNPKMLVRWGAFLKRAQQAHHPVFVPWMVFADLPEKAFADEARIQSARFVGHPDPARPINPLVAKCFADNPPKTLKDAAAQYGALLHTADTAWQDLVKRSTAAGQPLPARLPDPAQEELRHVFYGPDSPSNVAMNPLGDLDLLPDRPSQAKLQELRKAVETWRTTGPGAPPRAMVVEDLPTPYEPRVFRRGNPHNLGEAAPRQFLSILTGGHPKPFPHGSGRLDLADAIVDPGNPLTARVLVNRLWLHHFGAGLVRTPSDFGLRSQPPTHPELLDHLATLFRESGWSIKRMHRLIMLSAVYQQQSDDRPEGRRVDPENTLLWRMNRLRLDFEATRDALLAVSGRLQQHLGGIPARDLTHAGSARRTVYGFIDRLNLPGLFRTFDFPSPDATSPQRDTTTVAPQALFLMNSPFVAECARRLVQRPEVAGEKDAPRKVAGLYHVLYGRPPTGEEVGLGVEFLGSLGGTGKAWEEYALSLLLSNELVFVD